MLVSLSEAGVISCVGHFEGEVRMGRAIGAVVVAEVLWTALWLGGSVGAQALFSIDATQPLTNVGLLVGFIAYSVLVSVLAGFVCAVVRKETPMKTVWAFAFIQLVFGIGFEASAWAMTPVWYHLLFLALLVPTIVWGGRLRAGRAASA